MRLVPQSLLLEKEIRERKEKGSDDQMYVANTHYALGILENAA